MATQKQSERDPLIGALLSERYRVLERIAQGGMGVVYRARHVVLESDVAVKVLRQAARESARRRFLQEAKLASAVKHPHIAQVIDFGLLPDGAPFLVMELVPGLTLTDALAHTRIDPLRACRIGIQIAQALAAIHDQGIVHRDMKPDNIFVLRDRDGSDFVKIVDFGIAKAVEPLPEQVDTYAPTTQQPVVPGPGAVPPSQPSMTPFGTQAGQIMGTPFYMSPEQCDGTAIDARSDQYSLGCVLYELLSGQVPHLADTATGVLRKHIMVPATPLRQLVPERGISQNLDALVLRLLAKPPGARFLSMREVAKALQEEAARLEGQGRPVAAVLLAVLGFSVVDSQVHWASHRIAATRVLAALVSGALLALALTIGGGYLLWRRIQARSAAAIPSDLAAIRKKAISVLQQELANPAPTRRGGALLALGESGDPALRRLLEAGLSDPDPDVQGAAAQGLSHLVDRKIPEALRALARRSPASGPSLLAAQAIDRLGDESGRAILIEVLRTGGADARLQAAHLLCELPESAGCQLLRSLLERGLVKDGGAALSFLESLLQASAGERVFALRLLEERLRVGTREDERLSVLAILARAGHEPSRGRLADLVQHPSELQLTAAVALADPLAPQTATLFRSVLRDRRSLVPAQRMAVEGLGQSGDLSDLRLLAEFLAPDLDPELRATAARAILRLAKYSPQAMSGNSLTWAQSAMRSPLPQQRLSAAAVLGDIPGEEAVTLLGQLLRDSEPKVRRGSARALGRHREELAFSTLRGGLKDSDPDTRLATIAALGLVAKQLVALGSSAAVPQLATWLAEHVGGASEREQIRIHSLLLSLAPTGQSTHLAALAAFQSSTDPQVRRFLLDESPPDPLRAAAMLGDADPSVRFAAARQLAALGDARAIPVLRQAVQSDGADAVQAYALLQGLGEPVPRLADVVATLSRDPSVQHRIAVLESLAGVPGELALPLLELAAHDPEPLVRRLCAEVTADQANLKDAPARQDILKLLGRDRDAGVRVRASVLLSRLQSTMAALPLPPARASAAGPAVAADAVKPEPPTPPPATGVPPSSPADADENDDEDEPETADGKLGTLVLHGGTGVLFRIDDGSWQLWRGRRIRLAPGTHTLQTLSGSQELQIDEGKTVSATVSESPIEQSVKRGNSALQKKEISSAGKHFERARTLCEKGRERKHACGPLQPLLALRLARVLEAERRYAEAMAEYQSAQEGTLRGKERSELRSGIQRVTPKVGRIVVLSKQGKRCSEEVIWRIPGTHSVRVGGKSERVVLRAGDTVQLGRCR